MNIIHESTVEYNTLGQFERLGYSTMRGVDVDDADERESLASANAAAGGGWAGHAFPTCYPPCE